MKNIKEINLYKLIVTLNKRFGRLYFIVIAPNILPLLSNIKRNRSRQLGSEFKAKEKIIIYLHFFIPCPADSLTPSDIHRV